MHFFIDNNFYICGDLVEIYTSCNCLKFKCFQIVEVLKLSKPPMDHEVILNLCCIT